MAVHVCILWKNSFKNDLIKNNESVGRREGEVMSILTFKGGVHPFEGKDMSKNKPIMDLEPVGELVFPVSQHIGAPAVPVVEVGDKVLAGTLIAKASGFISANVHSSVSGVVKAIEPRMVAAGNKVLSIIVENDGLYEEEPIKNYIPWDKMTKENIRELVKAAGIVGMGGAGFPTNVKLTPKNEEDIDIIIINGAECEPYLTSDYRRMIEQPEILIGGLKVMLTLFDKAKGYIAVEDNKRDAIVKLAQLAKQEPKIEIKTLYTKYPQGGERALIYAVTGRKVNSSMLPADVGCIVNNVDTAFAIFKGVIEQKPLIQRIVTVSGDAVVNPGNFRVRIGTNTKEVVKAAGGFKKIPEKMISGGPMMGTAIYDLDIPITKGSSAITCFLKDTVSHVKQTNCINCGRCASVCPGRVLPSKLAKFAQQGDREMFEKYNGMECCECGCCSYICPAKRNLTQSIKSMRKDILASKKK